MDEERHRPGLRGMFSPFDFHDNIRLCMSLIDLTSVPE